MRPPEQRRGASGPGRLTALCLVAALIPLACRYQVRAPIQLDEAVAIDVLHSRARLVRSQSQLQHELAREIISELGWRVSPTGRLRIRLLLDEEQITATSTDIDDIPNAWHVTVRGRAFFEIAGEPAGLPICTFQGIGAVSSREREPHGLRRASSQAASRIVDWLEVHGAEIAAACERSAAPAVATPEPAPAAAPAPAPPPPAGAATGP